jgi:hypothetical protein
MLPRYFIFILCISAFCIVSKAQEPVESIFQSHLEDNFEADGTDFLPILEHLTQLSQNPMDINALDYEELMQLGLLSPIQVDYILSYRSKLGDFMDIHELQAVPELDLNTAILLSHVLRVDVTKQNTPVTFKNLLLFGKSELVFRARTFLEEDILYHKVDKNERKYLGNHHQYMLRYRYNFDNRIILSYLGEKDPGETLYKPKHSIGPDFNSANIALMNASKYVDIAVLGDFTVHLGQGLVSNASYSGGKSGSVMQISKTGKTIRPYGSVNEQGFYRGISISGRIKTWNYMFFGSAKPFDASLDTLNDSNGTRFTAIRTVQLTGLHRDSVGHDEKSQSFKFKFRRKSLSISFFRNDRNVPKIQVYRKELIELQSGLLASMEKYAFQWRISFYEC